MTQGQAILNHLKQCRKRGLTPIDALDLYGCWRLSGRILELRQAGYDILTEIEHRNGKHYARYRLVA